MKSLEQLDKLLSSNTKADEKWEHKIGCADKPYVSLKEGAAYYSMSVSTFRKYAKIANALCSFWGGSYQLVDMDIFEDYLERRRIEYHGII